MISGKAFETGIKIDVDLFEWAHLADQGILETSGLGPCIGVGIYDPVNKVGHLGHFPAQASSTFTLLDQMLDSASQNVVDQSKLRIWMGGGELATISESVIYDFEAIDTTADRQAVYERVTAKFLAAEIRIDWLDEPGVISYALDVATGDEDIEIEYDDPDVFYEYDDDFISEDPNNY